MNSLRISDIVVNQRISYRAGKLVDEVGDYYVVKDVYHFDTGEHAKRATWKKEGITLANNKEVHAYERLASG